MLLAPRERRLLLNVLKKVGSTSEQLFTIYEYMTPSVNTLSAMAKLTSGATEELQGALGKKVARALKALYGMLLRLHNDLSNQSKELCDLLVDVVELGLVHHIPDKWFKEVFVKHYDYIVSRIPIDSLFVDSQNSVEMYTLIVSSPTDVFDLCKLDEKLCIDISAPKDVLIKALESSSSTYVDIYQYLLRLAREKAEFDLGSKTLRVCGREVHLPSQTELARALMMLGLHNEYDALFAGDLKKMCTEVVKALGTQTYTSYLSHVYDYGIATITVPLSTFVGLSENPRAWVEIELPVYGVVPHAFTAYLVLGHNRSLVSIADHQLACQTAECVADAVANQLRNVRWNLIGRLVDAAWTLVKQGFRVADVSKNYDIDLNLSGYSVHLEKMVDDRTVVLATCSAHLGSGKLSASLKVCMWANGEIAKNLTIGLDSCRDAVKSLENKYGGKVSISSGCLHVRIPLDDHRILPKIVHDTLITYATLIEDKQ